jgi:CDP-diacylglycerol--serine O-phosphatidyltransferase
MRLANRNHRLSAADHSIIRLLPNVLTTLALCAGMNAIRFAIQHRWEAAVIAILVASILDVLDGRTARFLNAQSKFGAELDSLSDVVCFGVTPAILLYLWGLHAAGNFGWLAALSFSICAALRLARFNSTLGENNPRLRAGMFFTGVPTPAGAGLALLPMIIDFELELGVADHPIIVGMWTMATALLMVSRLPTFSLNGLRVRQRMPVLAIIGIAAGAVVNVPWATLTCVGVAYLISLPLTVLRYNRLIRSGAGSDEAKAGPVTRPASGDSAEIHTLRG